MRYILVFLLITLFSCNTPVPESVQQPKNTKPVKENIETKPVSHGMLVPPDLNDKLHKFTDKDIRFSPEMQSYIMTSGRYYDLAFVKDHILASANVRGVDFFETNIVNQLRMNARIHTTGHAWSLLTVDGNLWVADGYAGVKIIDPNTRTMIHEWEELDNARGFCRMDSEHVLVCRHSSGAAIVRTKIGDSPDVVCHICPTGKVFSAHMYESTLYLGTMGAGYIALTTNNLQNPREIWRFEGPSRILWCSRKADYHYLVDRDMGLWILKDRKNKLPELIAKLELDDRTRKGAWLNDTNLLLARKQGLSLVDVSDPQKPELISHAKAENEGRSVIVKNNRIFFCDSDIGIKEYTVNASREVRLKNYFSRERLMTDVVIQNDFVYLTNTQEGFKILKIVDGNLRPAAHFTELKHAVGVHVRDTMAAVVDNKGVNLIDVTVPEKPLLLGRLDTPGRAVGVHLLDGNVLVADWFEGVHIIDISDPRHPAMVSNVPVDGWAIDLIANDNFVYACCVNGGLRTIDITDPAKPVTTSIDNTCSAPEGITIHDKTLYLADFNSGLIVYDLSEKSTPKPLGFYDIKVCKGVQVRDNTLLLGNYIYGIKLFDVTDVRNPVLIGELDTPGKAYEMAFIHDTNAALVTDWHGLATITW